MEKLQNPEIRRFEKSKDLKKAQDLNKLAVLTPAIGAGYSERIELDPDHIRQTYIENKGEFLVVYVGRNLVAMGAVQKKDNRTAVISQVQIHPEYWMHGLAETLRNGLEGKARELEYRKILTEVQRENRVNQALCEKLGFHTVNMITKDGTDFFILEKELK